jgi:hypothetical protein
MGGANGLVNLRGAEGGWFEMDRLNEFFNLPLTHPVRNNRGLRGGCRSIIKILIAKLRGIELGNTAGWNSESRPVSCFFT